MEFNDSIQNNLDIIKELMHSVPPAQRQKARKAAVMLENTVTRLKKEYPRDNAVALGTAFAIFTLAERLVQAGKGGDREQSSMIQLLS